jgi:capsular exopolysaccharide synthesis family protein
MEQSSLPQILTARDILRVLFKNKMVIITTFLITLLTVYLGFQFKTPVFETEVKMLVTAKKQIESQYYRDLLDYRKADIAVTQSEIVRSSPVLERTVSVLALEQRPQDYERLFASKMKIIVFDFLKQATDFFMDIYYIFLPRPANQPDSPEVKVIKAIAELKKNIEVEAIKDTDIFVIKVQDFHPLAAMAIANVVSRSYLIFDLEQQLSEMQLKFGEKHQAVAQLAQTIETMKKNLNGTRLPSLEAIGPASVKVIDQANVPLHPAGKPRLFYYLIGAVLGIILGIILAFLFEHFDQSFKSPQELENFLDVPLLGFIPNPSPSKTQTAEQLNTSTAAGAAFDHLSDQLFLLTKDQKIKSILFTAPQWQKKDALVVAQLAELLSARLGLKILLIDANLRAPSLHRFFKKEAKKGLTDVVEGKVELKEAISPVSDRMFLLPAGKSLSNPILLLGSGRAAKTFHDVQQSFDLTMINSPDLKDFKDVSLLADLVVNVVLIVNQRMNRRQVLGVVVNPLKKRDVRILGVILNERTFSIPKIIYDRI